MKTPHLTSFTLLILVLSFCSSAKVFAHCDTLDGPVVAAARQALQQRDVTPVLKWVNAEMEYVHFVEALHTLAARGAEERAHLHTSAEASH
jgi:hypothetical protein